MTGPGPLSSEDYDAISAAVMETDRGRWFLAEYARRNRSADTAAVLDALHALERRIAEARPRPEPAPNDRLAAALEGASERAKKLRRELADGGAPQRRVERALRHLDLLDRLIATARQSAGLSPRTLAPPAAPAAVQAAGPEAVHALASPDAVASDAPAAAAPDAAAEPPPPDAPVQEEASPPPGIDAAAASMEAATTDQGEPEDASPTVEASLAALSAAPPEAGRMAASGSDFRPDVEIFTFAPPAARPEPEPEPEVRESPAEAEAPAPKQDAGANGKVIDVSAILGQEAAAPEASGDRKPAKLPPAWTPTLLEGLTEEEKAILFA